MTALWREPLLYFLAAGLALFAIARVFGGDAAERIVVSAAEQDRLSAQWLSQMGRPPTDAELEGLVEQWIREEIYYREALALGLDEGDVIVRRRLAQKLTFLTEDLATAAQPDQATLQHFFEEHAGNYTQPERFTFSHRYFSGERREQAEADARAALRSAAPEGDPFLLQQSYAGRSQRDIAELFGREFAAALAALPDTEAWQGPLRSAYGWHLVRIEARQPARLPDFGEVAERVAADYQQDQRRLANEAFYESLRARYQVARP